MEKLEEKGNEEKKIEAQMALNKSCINEVPSNQMKDIISISTETTNDKMQCNGMPRSESTKDHDKSCTESSIEDNWKGCTMKYINNVKKEPSG
eukprot:8765654-Ditylum_brightwellii.AAC.1